MCSTDALLLAAVKNQVATIQQCTAYVTTPTVQTAVTNLVAGAATLDTTITAHGKAVAQVLTLAG